MGVTVGAAAPTHSRRPPVRATQIRNPDVASTINRNTLRLVERSSVMTGIQPSRGWSVGTEIYRDDERRRAFKRARTVENNAPADPTSARTTVGFSGESVQPVWACNGAAINRKSADQKRNCTDLFIFFSTSPINLLELKVLRQLYCGRTSRPIRSA